MNSAERELFQEKLDEIEQLKKENKRLEKRLVDLIVSDFARLDAETSENS